MKRIFTSFLLLTLCFLTGTAQSLKLNGADQYMSIPNDAAFFPTAGGEYTVTCKVKIDEWGRNMRFVGAWAYPGTDTSEATGYDIWGGNNEFSFLAVNAALQGDPWGNNLNFVPYADGLGHYVHVAWVFNGPQKVSTTYLNGEEGTKLEKEAFATGEWGNHGFDILVGAGYESHWGSETSIGNFLNGEIDDVHFYNKALTAEELAQDKDAFSATHANLVAAYDFNAIAGTTVPDVSGHGHNGQLHGIEAAPDTKMYVVTVASDLEGGYITANKGTNELVQSGEEVAENTEIKLIAYPYEGYELDHFTVNGEVLEGDTYVMLQSATFAAVFKKSGTAPSEPEYAVPDEQHNRRADASARLVKTVTVEGATLKGEPAPFTSVINDGYSQPYVYLDKTAEAVDLTVGDEVKVNMEHDVIWMHSYLYIDYNHDGVFNEENELVSYSFFDEDNNKTGVNSLGETLSEGPATLDLPKFTVADIDASVTTRMRLKIDWNSKNPVGSTSQNIANNNGTIVDFTANLHMKPGTEKFTVNFDGAAENGTFEVVDEKSGKTLAAGDQVLSGTELTVRAKGAYGYIVKEIRVNGKTIEGNQFTVDSECRIEVIFANTFWVKYDKNPEHGTLSVDDFYVDYEPGADITLGSLLRVIITPDEGYLLESFTVNGEDKMEDIRTEPGSPVMTWIAADVQYNVTIEATFYKFIAPHTVTFTASKGGIVRVEDVTHATSISSGAKMDHESELFVKVIPDPHYELTSFMVNNEEKLSEVDMTGSRPTFRMKVVDDTDISVVFSVEEGIADAAALQEVRYDAAGQQIVLPEGAVVAVYNAAGQLVRRITGEGNLSTSAWSSGAYIVRVACGGAVKVFKIIK